MTDPRWFVRGTTRSGWEWELSVYPLRVVLCIVVVKLLLDFLT